MDMVSTLAALFMVICVWGLISNHRTGKERLDLIKAAFRNPDNWRELSKELDEVTYDRHLEERMLFRNPFNLYSIRLQAAYGSLLAN
jgi:hypothetical protein